MIRWLSIPLAIVLIFSCIEFAPGPAHTAAAQGKLYELACPAGTFPIDHFDTYNSITQMWRANICTDTTGHVTFNGVQTATQWPLISPTSGVATSGQIRLAGSSSGCNGATSGDTITWSSGGQTQFLCVDQFQQLYFNGNLKLCAGSCTSGGALVAPDGVLIPYVQVNGTQNVSGCSLTSAVGGSTAGSFHSGTAGTCTVTITPGFTASNGWTVDAHDLTTAADANNMVQTASTTTTATIAGTTASGDVITWKATAF